MKTIAVLTSGSAGDVLPIASLAGALARRGYRVRLACPRRFASSLATPALELYGCRHNPTDLLMQSGQAALSISAGLVRGAVSSLAYLGRARPVLRGLLDEFQTASQGADGLLVSLPSLWAAGIALRQDLPWAAAFVQPFTPSRSYPAALLPLRLPDRPFWNRIGHALVGQALNLPWRTTVAAWARESLGCRPERVNGWHAELVSGRAPAVYGLSPRLFPPPPDWPDNHRLSGFWFPDPDPAWQAEPLLVDFLHDGPAPLYIGFGSIAAGLAAGLLTRVRQLAGAIGGRIILSIPGMTRARRSSPAVLETGPLPHLWLFPQLRAVVHHGGAGTTAAALSCGLPQMIVPTSTDHFFWAGLITRLGFGRSTRRLEPGPLRKLLEDEALRARCAGCARDLAAEQGPEQAAGFLAGLFR